LDKPSSKTPETFVRGESDSLKDDAKKGASNIGPVQAGSGTETRVEKVRSSRYEWESNAGENENKTDAPNAPRRLTIAVRFWVKKLFFGQRDTFGNDDASPNAA
jgi:hypothetical protein